MSTLPANLYDVVDATWPAARKLQLGKWTLRQGQGGGSRVSAATTDGPVEPGDIEIAEQGMRDLGQQPLFSIRQGQQALDQMLEARGYEAFDPVNMYICPVGDLCGVPLPRVTVLTVWEPLAIMREIWAEGGIGPARLAVMDRVQGPKTGLLGRKDDKPAGVGFVAMHDGIAMLHALEVVPFQRRKGMGVWFMRAAALWARENGATWMSVICTRDNAAANALYSSLGMRRAGEYHYRRIPKETASA